MKDNFSRHDFIIKDLAVSVAGSLHGGTWLPGPDQPTPPSPISPIASVLVNIGLIEAVRGTITEAVHAKKFDDVARAFVPGDAGGNPAIRAAIQQIGAAVVASAAYAALGGSAGMPNPECGGTSFETIPPTLTPVIHTGFQVHRVTELPRLRAQLEQTLDYVNKAAAAQVPASKEVPGVRAKLQEALSGL